MEKPELNDIYGKAILDYYHGKNVSITTYSSVGGKDELPVEHLFRSFDKMPDIEQVALNMSTGKVLDLGCGAGSHSLYLQEKDHEVKSIDISQGAIEVCLKRGLKNAEVIDLWDLKGQKFDTILSLMNGAGICGSLDKLADLMVHLKSLLRPNGQILIDSSDIIYMFEDEEGEVDLPDEDHYYGEVEFDLQYNGEKSGAFPWLYIDYYNLKHYAEEAGFKCKLVRQGDHYDYLARLTINAEDNTNFS
jgi:SAM-dependent methyltransferase